MKDIFLADAHLTDPQSAAYRLLLQFLDSQQGQIRNLILLGDIFEFWVGYRHCVFSAYLPLLQRLQSLHEQGVHIIMVEGNHDFHMGPFFTDVLGCTLFSDGGEVQLGATRVYLCHGDTVQMTFGYRLLRTFFRSAVARALIRVLPADLTWAIADTLGRASRRRRQRRPPRDYQPPYAALRDYASHHFSNGCQALLCGHFHHSWQHSESDRHILIVGNWDQRGCYAVHEKGEFRLESFTPPPSATALK